MEFDFEAGKNPVADFFAQNPALLREPTRRERLEAETELFGYAVSGHPLELFADVAWDTYCPVARLGETVVTCGNRCWKSPRRWSRLRTGGAFHCGFCERGNRVQC